MYRLAPMHIFKTADGKGEYIDMEMQKTEKPVIIPLSEEAKRWLPKPRGNDIQPTDLRLSLKISRLSILNSQKINRKHYFYI